MGLRSAELKREIEAQLAHRVPAALSPVAQQLLRLHPTGNPALDELLGGGLPLGSVCEVTGPEGCGRSSLALSLLSQACHEAACAYIDISDTLSPKCAAAAGVNLENLLWSGSCWTKRPAFGLHRRGETGPCSTSMLTTGLHEAVVVPLTLGTKRKGWHQRWRRCFSRRRTDACARWRAPRATQTSLSV